MILAINRGFKTYKLKKNFRAKFGCTTWQDRLWVVGGYDRSTLQTTENFDIFSEKWQEGPKLLQKRHSAPIVSTTSGLFVIGEQNFERCNIF